MNWINRYWASSVAKLARPSPVAPRVPAQNLDTVWFKRLGQTVLAKKDPGEPAVQGDDWQGAGVSAGRGHVVVTN
jgi:hypothetical protein